jgi:hypothetical protein
MDEPPGEMSLHRFYGEGGVELNRILGVVSGLNHE